MGKRQRRRDREDNKRKFPNESCWAFRERKVEAPVTKKRRMARKG